GARHALAVELELGVGLALAEGRRLRRPAEDLLVERHRAVEAARAELGPAEGAGYALHPEAVHHARLPGRDEGAAGVLVDGHRPLRADLHPGHDHGAARLLDLLAGGRGGGGADVDRPRGGLIGVHRRADAGDVLAAQLADRVAAVLRIGVD